MNKQKQQKMVEALARCDGFTSLGTWPNGSPIWDSKEFSVSGNEVVTLPDYLTSHDAMQPLIDGLEDSEGVKYQRYLHEITKPKGMHAPSMWGMGAIFKATAEQEAEAYLKAKGLWQEEGE
jgi:hypothetical protein